MINRMLRSLIKTMRPKQWAKSLFLFTAIVFDRQLFFLDALWHTAAGFILFSLLASTIYIINDLSDIEADRQHPKKRHRPIPSGELPISVAIGAAIAIWLIVFPTAFWLSTGFGIICTIYFFGNLIYSRWLKHIALLDVLLLASFYVLRVAAGVTLIEVERFSPWLYVFTIFIALYLGIGKRRAELVSAQQNGGATRKVLQNYTLPFLDQLISIVLTISILTYSLYTFSAPNLPPNNSMMLTIPFMIYIIFRYLYLLQVEGHGESPEDILFGDRPLQAAIVLWGIAILVIFYWSPR